MDRANKKLAFRNITLAVLIIAIMIFVSIKYAPWIISIKDHPEEFRRMILSYGYTSVLVFIAFQVLQIVIPFIPGEVAQMAGGYIYGTLWGSIYLLIGAFIGETIVFYLTRFVGYPLVKIFVSPKNLDKFGFLIKNKKTEFIMFLLFLMPGIPKDVLVYIAGLTPMAPARFLVISVLARAPALIATTYIGSKSQQQDFKSIVVVIVVALIFLAAGFFARKKMFSAFDKFHKE